MAKKSIQLRDNAYLEDYYQAVIDDRHHQVKLYHSDVFFVRAALERRLGFLPSLAEIEAAMKDAGWRD